MYVVDEDIVHVVFEHCRLVHGLRTCQYPVSDATRLVKTYRKEASRENVQQAGLSARAVSEQDQLPLDDPLAATKWHRCDSFAVETGLEDADVRRSMRVVLWRSRSALRHFHQVFREVRDEIAEEQES